MPKHITYGKTPHHTREELNAAAVAAREGGTVEVDRLCRMMLPYVLKVASDYGEGGSRGYRGGYTVPRFWHDQEEIRQQAWIGVLKAVPNFDPDKGTKFSTFAHKYMRNEIHQWMSSNTGSLTLSRRQWIHGKRIEEAYREAYPDGDIDEADDALLASLEFPSYDTKGKVSRHPFARDILKAKRLPELFDPDIVEQWHEGTRSAEDEFFEESDTMDEDALATYDKMKVEDDEAKAKELAQDFAARHGLQGTAVVANMMRQREEDRT